MNWMTNLDGLNEKLNALLIVYGLMVVIVCGSPWVVSWLNVCCEAEALCRCRKRLAIMVALVASEIGIK